jgi:hypothetical protein
VITVTASQWKLAMFSFFLFFLRYMGPFKLLCKNNIYLLASGVQGTTPRHNPCVDTFQPDYVSEVGNYSRASDNEVTR